MVHSTKMRNALSKIMKNSERAMEITLWRIGEKREELGSRTGYVLLSV